jgi:murein DD-endopeptidase MepM/ murein hydrolase activator NlpD
MLILVSCTVYVKPERVMRTQDMDYIISYHAGANTNADTILEKNKAIGSVDDTLVKKAAEKCEKFIAANVAMQSFEDAFYTHQQQVPDSRLEVGETDVWSGYLEPLPEDGLNIIFELDGEHPYLFSYFPNQGVINVMNHRFKFQLTSQETESLLSSGLFDPFTECPTPPTVDMNTTDAKPMIFNEWNTLYYTVYGHYERSFANESEVLPSAVSHQDMYYDLTEEAVQVVCNDFIPDNINLTIYDESHLVISENTISASGNLITVDTSLLPDSNGYYKGILNMSYSTDSIDAGNKKLEFFFTINREPIFESMKETYQPGDLVRIKVSNIKGIEQYTITSETYHTNVSTTPMDDGYVVILPLTSRLTPGSYTVSFQHNTDDSLSGHLTLTIVDKVFEVQYLETSSSTASLQNDDNYDQLNEAFARGRSNSLDTKQWDSAFLQPADGRISTEYGVIRYTNGSESSSRHSGIDFANESGTVIYATHNGVVTLSEYINITGNTIFIDHGLGIFSQYYHCLNAYVEVGDYVKKGDPIGEIGSTGFSTGPHLHFAIYYSGVYLNPWKFFDEMPF